jgi:putative endopeptidase
MLRARLARLSALLLLSVAACDPAQPPPDVPVTPTPPPPTAPPAAPQAAAPRVKPVSLDAVGLDPAALDPSADPCTDFYQFACGNWISKAEIPADKPRWDRSFTAIGDRNEASLRKIVEQDAKAKDADPGLQKVGAYYDACMDEATIEADKLKPLQPLLAVVKKVKDKKSLTAAVLELHRRRVWALFDLSDTQDFKDATKVIAEIDQNGLGLPDRDYYVKEDDKSKDIRQKYLGHVERMMALAGLPAKDAKKAAADVLRIETELARASKTRVERRDPKAVYNKIDRPGVAKAAPSFLWDDYFKGLGFPAINDINVTHVPFLEAVNKLVDTLPPSDWQTYLTWHLVRGLADALPKAFIDESFSMAAALTGQKENRPRWKRCITDTDAALGELLAQRFVKLYFSPESKEATQRYVLEISQAFAREVDKLSWMDAPTKQKAIAKLSAMAYLIGYPNKWREYDFEIKPKRFADNTLAARAFRLRYRLSKVGKPLDRDEWQMTPPTVNAYYDSLRNHMVFPAGILQPPFFSPAASVAVNLGGMGMVVGHELTHGFDDQGSQFDAKGNLENWWTDQVSSQFKAKTACVEEQYSGYEALPGLKVNGKLTLGENIADNGGVKLAFAAYRAMRKGADEVTVAGGYSEDQQFFLGVGQAWCTKQRDEFARLRVQIDPHSPSKYRVNGPLSSFPAFADAFSCKAGAPMRRQNRCDVW